MVHSRKNSALLFQLPLLFLGAYNKIVNRWAELILHWSHWSQKTDPNKYVSKSNDLLVLLPRILHFTVVLKILCWLATDDQIISASFLKQLPFRVCLSQNKNCHHLHPFQTSILFIFGKLLYFKSAQRKLSRLVWHKSPHLQIKQVWLSFCSYSQIHVCVNKVKILNVHHIKQLCLFVPLMNILKVKSFVVKYTFNGETECSKIWGLEQHEWNFLILGWTLS